MLDLLSRLRTRKEVEASWRAALSPVLACITSCECFRGCTERGLVNDQLQLLSWVAREQQSATDAVRRCLIAGVCFVVACGLSRDRLYSLVGESLLDGLGNSLTAMLEVPEAAPGLWQLAHFAVHVIVKRIGQEKLRHRIVVAPSNFCSSSTSVRPLLASIMMRISLDGIRRSGVLHEQYGNIGKHDEEWRTFQMCIQSVARMLKLAEYQDMTATVFGGSLSGIITWCLNTVSALFSTASYHNVQFLTAASCAANFFFDMSGAMSLVVTCEQTKQLWDTCLEMFLAFAVSRDCPPYDVVCVSKCLIMAVENLIAINYLISTVTSTMHVTGMMKLLYWSYCHDRRSQYLLTDDTNTMATQLYHLVGCSCVREAWFTAFFTMFRYEHLSPHWLQAMQAVLHGMPGRWGYTRWGCGPPAKFNWSRRQSIEFLAGATQPLFPAGTSLQTATGMVHCMSSVAREPWLCLCAVFVNAP